MHSSGRGEESPDAYRGVVLPSDQHQQPLVYGEHVQPAGGSPWGAPAPEPADATQMLPPYPAGVPAPGAPAPADATQMLPPYPGGAPQQPAGQGVPPLPPVPPQAPHTPQVQYASDLPAAEATQALPMSAFQEDQGYQRQGYEQPSYDQAGYGGQAPYGTQPSYGQEYTDYEEQPAGPQHDSDYDHLFRNDVPSPAPVRPHIIQPPSQQQGRPPYGRQPAQAPAGQAGGRPPYGQQPGGYEPAYAYDDGDGGSGGRRRMSPKVLIGIVVAGCVVAGLVLGGLLSGGGKSGKDDTVAGSSTSAPPGASASSTDAPSGDTDAAEQQAQALDSLLSTSDASRSSVVSAVESIKNCKELPGAASDLRAAAGQRKDLITQLSKLSVDQLPNHAALTDALTKAWQASSAADSHYAGWADQAQHGHKVCKGGHARTTSETLAGNRESGTATTQKKNAVKLWNSIAKKYGLTQRQFSQL